MVVVVGGSLTETWQWCLAPISTGPKLKAQFRCNPRCFVNYDLESRKNIAHRISPLLPGKARVVREFKGRSPASAQTAFVKFCLPFGLAAPAAPTSSSRALSFRRQPP